ncbi:MAG: hypothetical protein PF637_03245 [Spirochaetes bacterium]|jgi:hypothetical protein|nr:hypothetical protein [Spirochaetota bacterium]
MKSNKPVPLFIYAFLVLLFFFPLAAKTTTSIENNPLFPNISLAEGEEQRFSDDFARNVKKNAPNFAEAFYLQNMLGYVIGKPHIKGWQAGVVIGSAFANGKYWDGDAAADTYPAFAPIVTIHLGKELDSRSDVIGKIIILDLFMTGKEPDLAGVTLEDYRQFTIGGKYRRQIFEGKRLLPFLLNFEGITAGASADILTGYMGARGVYEVEQERTTVTTTSGDATTDTYLEGDYTAKSTWIQMSFGFDVISYFRIMRFMNIYTGLGCALGYSWFGMKAVSEGELMARDDSLDTLIGDGFNYQSDHLLTMSYRSDYVFNPFPLMPISIIGCEIDIVDFSLTLETAVNLYNLEDVTMVLGARYQF